jgi:hypothetical protein
MKDWVGCCAIIKIDEFTEVWIIVINYPEVSILNIVNIRIIKDKIITINGKKA